MTILIKPIRQVTKEEWEHRYRIEGLEKGMGKLRLLKVMQNERKKEYREYLKQRCLPKCQTAEDLKKVFQALMDANIV